MFEEVVVQDYSEITQLTTVVIERASFLEFLSGGKFLWEFLWQVLTGRGKGGGEHPCIGVMEFSNIIPDQI